ncbi:MAG: thioredoxin domain-containing protein [Chryseolinea sp.]
MCKSDAWKLICLLLCCSISDVSSQSKEKLSPQEFHDAITSSPGVVLLDVRTPKEFGDGYIANAMNIDYNAPDFKEKLKTLDKNVPYYVYCLSGGRSNSAVKFMRSKGFKHAYELDGGILKWTYPLTGTEKSEATADEISNKEYDGITSAEKIVVIDFYAPWCGPCKKMKPMLEALATEYKGMANIVRINIDDNKRLIKTLGISEIPVVKIYKDGKETWNRVGFTERSAIVDQLKAQ